ncbi:MAG TPA: FAD-dependent oxidoreductase [Polyangiaceae bacterium]|nr:FAD-dependent oxidoreductase [Polyangiaceae bacterium]
MKPLVCVVGGGIAGAAAALAAAREDVRVTLVDAGTGASGLCTGAIDRASVPEPPGPIGPIEDGARAILDALGAYFVSSAGALFVSTGGVVRPAAGGDASLLDVARLPPGPVGVVACSRPGWDAAALAVAWGERYRVFDAAILRTADERAVPDADFAARHDDPERLAWLSERLREAVARQGQDWAALVLPPSLGATWPRAPELSRLAGLSCGEAIGLPGGPAGLRFEAARDQALSAAGVERLRARVMGIQRADGAWRVLAQGATEIDATAVVLATGGLVGGGVEYAPAEGMHATAVPYGSRPFLRLTLDAPAVLGVRGAPLESPSSLFGTTPEALAWPWTEDCPLERAGVVSTASGLFAAGDLVADAPRTWLAALEGGARAGRAAAQ